MRDYLPLQSNHNLLEPEPQPVEDREEQQPVVVEAVCNYHEDEKSKTVAFTVSIQLPQLHS